MKSILLKIDDELYSEVETSAKELNTSKTGYIEKALESYIKVGREEFYTPCVDALSS